MSAFDGWPAGARFGGGPGVVERVASSLREFGIAVVRGFLAESEVEPLRATLRRLITARLCSLGEDVPTNVDIDSLLDRLAGVDRRHVMEIIREAKDSPEFYELMVCPRIVALARATIGTELLQVVHDTALLRIDRPNDNDRNLEWHYDYPYNMTSQSALTTWLPLTSVTESMGPMRVILASHSELRPMVSTDYVDELNGGNARKVFTLDASGAELDDRAITGSRSSEGIN